MQGNKAATGKIEPTRPPDHNERRTFTMAETTLAQATIQNPEVHLGLPDFADWRVFAVSETYADCNHAQVYGPDDFTAHQAHDGPSYIFVGSRVLDERLERNLPMLRQRYGVTLDQLQAARSGLLVNIRIEKPAHW
jgi:hypothetical protein